MFHPLRRSVVHVGDRESAGLLPNSMTWVLTAFRWSFCWFSQLAVCLRSLHVQKFYNGVTVILPTLDYCDVWDGCTKTASDKLEVVHLNNAARAILGAPYRSSATQLRCQLGWSTLSHRRNYHTTIWTYRCLRGHTPLTSEIIMFTPNSNVHQHSTRQSNGLYIPQPKTTL